MKNKILITSSIGALSLSKILNADVDIDGKVLELKQKGFDVKVEEIKQKVYSHDELEIKRAEENTKLISEVSRLDNIEKEYKQDESLNSYIKDEINRKNEAIDRANEARKLENARREKEYNDLVAEINRRNKEINIKILEENKIITNGNNNVNKDYSKELKRITDDKAERVQDAKEQADLADKTNAKIKEETAERARLVKEENLRRRAEYDKEVSRINSENEKIKLRNKEKEDSYNKQLAEYNAKLKDVSSLPVVNESNGLKLVGSSREDLRGSAKYYSGYKLFTDRDDIDVPDGAIGISSKSEVKDLTGGIKFRDGDPKGNVGGVWKHTFSNITKGSSFVVTNMGKTKSGKNINIKYTMLEDYVTNNDRKYVDNEESAFTIEAGGIYGNPNDRAEISVSTLNIADFRVRMEFFDDKGQPINMAFASVNSDIDWSQSFGLKYVGPNSLTFTLNPENSKLVKLSLGGNEAYGDANNEGVDGYASIPAKSFLSAGSGTGLEIGFYNNSLYYEGTPLSKHSKNVLDKDFANNVIEATKKPRSEWGYVAAYFGMFGPSSDIMDSVIKPVKPELEKLDETKPVLNLITGVPGRSNIYPNDSSDIPEKVSKPKEEPLKNGKELPLPAKPDMLPLLDKVSGTVNGRVQAKKSIVVKKYIYEYLNTSAGNTITIRDIKKEKLVYAFATSLKLRNLN